MTRCGSCHSDPNQIPQYGLPTGIVAEFRTSRHRMLLQQRNEDAPTCTSCHDAHLILRPDDARSNVSPTNITTTCAPCHSPPAMTVATFECASCHEQHHAPANRSCASCHPGDLKATHAGLGDDLHVRAPACSSCHEASREITRWSWQTCSACHTDQARGHHEKAAGSARGCESCHDITAYRAIPKG